MKSLMIVIVLFISFSVFGIEKRHFFRNYTALEGLSQHDVNCMIQDDKGYLWMGTHDGLNRFDGYNYKVYKPTDGSNSSILGRVISNLATDCYSNIWISTLDGGISTYNPRKETFFNFYPQWPSMGNYTNRIRISNDSILWIQSSSKIFYSFIEEKAENMKFFMLPPDLYDNDNDIEKELEINNGTITYTTAVGKYRLDYKKTNDGLKNIRRKRVVSVPLTVRHEKTPLTWEIYDDRVVLTANNGNKISRDVVISPIKLALDHSGALWCTLNDKLAVLYLDVNTIKLEYVNMENSESFESENISVKSLYIDHIGNLWVGTNSNGVYMSVINSSNFLNIRNSWAKGSLCNNIIRSVHEDQFGNLWIGTEGGGISFLSMNAKDYSSFKTISPEQNNKGITSGYVFSIAENVISSEQSILWFGTENGGINKLKINRNTRFEDFRFVHFNTQSTEGNNIFSSAIHSMKAEGKNRLWLGYYGVGLGLAEWDTPESHPKFYLIKSTAKERQLKSNAIRNIFRDSYGILWIATDNGLFEMNENSNNITNSTFQSYKHDSKDDTTIGGNYILQLFETKDHTTWIGTIGGGLNKMVRKNDGNVMGFKSFSKNNKLFPDDVVNSLVEDSSGFLWVGTNSGIVKFNPMDESYEEFGYSELQNFEMSEVSAINRRNGEMVFGGINGLNVFNPGECKKTNILPETTITEFKIMYETIKPNEPFHNKIILAENIAYTNSITLNYKTNSFSFKFSSMHFNYPRKNKYKYKLDGFDTNWIETGSDSRIANYTNLNPGNYTFQVFGSNDAGEWSEKPAKIEIKILPPWYLSSYAKITYVLLAIIVLMAYRRLNAIRHKKKRKSEYERIEKERINELNQIKLQFFTNISHELRSPLTLISGPIEKLINKSGTLKQDEQLMLFHTIKRNSDYLLKLIAQLLDFRKLEQGKMKLECTHINLTLLASKIIEVYTPFAEDKQIKINLSFSQQKIFAWIDINVLEKILHNLLSNALKFTPPGGEIHVDLNELNLPDSGFPDGRVEIIVEDNGIGIKESDLANIFDRFYQVNDKNYSNQGVGIGLSFSQSLAKLHGGIIKVRSKPGKGARFSFIIPIGNKHLAEEQMLDNNNNIVISKAYEQTLIEQNKVIEYKNDGKPSILIIEDNAEINQYISSEFNQFYSITSSFDGISGSEIAFEKLPDIIICDVMMPGMNGIEVCKKVKNDIKTSHIPVILLSAKTTDENKIEGLEANADVYLTKPFNIEVLSSQIISLLENRKKLQHALKASPFEPPKIKISSIDDQFITDVISIINKNIDNPGFTVEEFTKCIGLSRSTFFIKIKTLTGQKPTEFLRNYRLKMAAQYLEKGYSIKEAMHKTGFNTPSYFTKSFKLLFEKTPTEYFQEIDNLTDS